jgi:hypothetical protein
MNVIATHCWRSVRNNGFKDKKKNTNKKINKNTKIKKESVGGRE